MPSFDDPEEAALLRPYFPVFAAAAEEAIGRIRHASGNVLIDVRPRTRTTTVTDTICRLLRKQLLTDPNVQFRVDAEVDMPIFFRLRDLASQAHVQCVVEPENRERG